MGKKIWQTVDIIRIQVILTYSAILRADGTLRTNHIVQPSIHTYIVSLRTVSNTKLLLIYVLLIYRMYAE